MVVTTSVIIPVYNDRIKLSHCLKSIYDTDHKDFEVIVVDDYSTQDIKEIAELFPCRYLRLSSNRGQAHARNYGVKLSHGRVLLFLDSDCYAMKDWVMLSTNELMDAHHKDNQVAAIFGRLKSDEGFFAMCHAYTGYAYVQSPVSRSMNYLNTSCAAIFKENFESVGGFDEQLRNGEDPDLAMRLVNAGKKVIYEPSVTVYHNHGIDTFSKMLLKHRQWGRTLGLGLIKKHPEKYQKLLPLLMNPVIHFLIIVPLAFLTTLKIVSYNFKYDQKVILYSPFIFISKVMFRWGIFTNSVLTKGDDCANSSVKLTLDQ